MNITSTLTQLTGTRLSVEAGGLGNVVERCAERR